MGGNQFYSLGSYDQGMEVWGGENVEMSMRLWTCGASIRMLPYQAFGPLMRPRLWPIMNLQ